MANEITAARIAIDQNGKKIEYAKWYAAAKMKEPIKLGILKYAINNPIIKPNKDDMAKGKPITLTRNILIEIEEDSNNTTKNTTGIGKTGKPAKILAKFIMGTFTPRSSTNTFLLDKADQAKLPETIAEHEIVLNKAAIKHYNKKVFTEGANTAGKYKLFSGATKDKIKDTDRTDQPAQAGTLTAGAVTALKAGKRIVVSTDLDASEFNRYDVVMAAVDMMLERATDGGAEPAYPFEYSALPSEIVVQARSHEAIRLIKSRVYTRYTEKQVIDEAILKLNQIEFEINPYLNKKDEYVVMAKNYVGLFRNLLAGETALAAINYSNFGSSTKVIDPETGDVVSVQIEKGQGTLHFNINSYLMEAIEGGIAFIRNAV